MPIAGQIIFNQGDTPTTPDAGKISVYSKTDDKLYYIDSSGIEHELTASGVSGASTLLELTDTPAAYDDGKYLRSTASGAEWATVSGADAFIELTDTPSSYDGGKYLRSTSSGTEWATVSGGTGTSDHDALNNLDYASAGHTGFQPAGTYITDTEMTTISGDLVSQIPTDFYTQSEVDSISGALQDSIDLKYDKAGGTISGNVIIQGNLTVTGTEFIQHVETVEIDDNLLLINANETGAGVTKGWGGIEVDRGTETNYQFMFIEADENFQVGISGSLQPVATRRDSADMDDGYVTYWDAANYRLVTESGIAVADIASTNYVDTSISTVSGVLQNNIDDKVGDKIEEGNSSVEVIDAGTGSIVNTVDGNARVVIGPSTTQIGDSASTNITGSALEFKAETTSALVGVACFDNAADQEAQLILYKSRGNSSTSPTTVADGDRIGTINFGGYDGDSWEYSAYLACEVDDTVSEGIIPMKLVLATSPDAAANRTERLSIRSNGTIEVSNSIQIDATPSSDHSVTGTTTIMTVGEAVVFGDMLYMKSDGKLWKADADADTTMPVMAMATATISTDADGSVLLLGFVRDDTYAFTVGGLIYASTTAGAVTQTVTSGTGDMVQVIGVATHADRMYFAPNFAMGEWN